MMDTANANCAANGCPASAAMSRSTTGTTEWWCAFHFSTPPARIHEVTAELRRLEWLVLLCKGIRHDINTGVWTAAAAQGWAEIALHQRSDLYQQAGNATTPPESSQQWLARLESVLQQACALQAEPQQPLDV